MNSLNEDITPLNKEGLRHGLWERYYDNGNLQYRGSYAHDLRHGYWERYCEDGLLNYKGCYSNGKPIGYWYDYNPYYGECAKAYYI